MGVLALLSLGFVIWFSISRRRAIAELARVKEFRRGDFDPYRDAVD